MDDLFRALALPATGRRLIPTRHNVARQGFAKVANKWKRKAMKSASKIAAVLQISEEDALQEVLLNMWQAYLTYHKHQVRLDGSIWDVVDDGMRYTLEHPTSKKRIVVARWRVEPIDKRMSAASFVYMRMLQWQHNLFTLHYTARNGYARAPEKVKINGKEKSTFVRVVFEESLEGAKNFEDEAMSWHDVLEDELLELPETSAQSVDLLKEINRKLDPMSRVVLGIYALEGLPLPDSNMNDVTYVACVLGISRKEARAALKKILNALPKDVKSHTAMFVKRHRDGDEVVKRQPVQETLGGRRALRGAAGSAAT